MKTYRAVTRGLVSAGVALVAALGFALAGPMAPAHAAATVRIMPLGDSITGSPGCWRSVLWNRLENSGYKNIDMVGSLNNNGSCAQSFDADNEGHGGYTAAMIVNNNLLPGWLSSAKPDIVMMHLGTNDVWNSAAVSPDTVLARYTSLIAQMRANNPKMQILVAKILPMAPSGCGSCSQNAANLDNAIPAWASSHTTSASPITVVDQFSGFNDSTDTIDGVHPNDSGNQKMSDRWYPALTAAITAVGNGGSGGTGGSTTGPVTGEPIIGASGRCVDVPGQSTTNGTQVQLWDCNGQSNQAWIKSSASELKVYGNKCLDAYGWGTANGTVVDIYDCNGQANQKWTVNSNGTITSNNAPGLCLDATGQGTADGTLLQLWACNGQDNQKWTF